MLRISYPYEMQSIINKQLWLFGVYVFFILLYLFIYLFGYVCVCALFFLQPCVNFFLSLSLALSRHSCGIYCSSDSSSNKLSRSDAKQPNAKRFTWAHGLYSAYIVISSQRKRKQTKNKKKWRETKRAPKHETTDGIHNTWSTTKRNDRWYPDRCNARMLANAPVHIALMYELQYFVRKVVIYFNYEMITKKDAGTRAHRISVRSSNIIFFSITLL